MAYPAHSESSKVEMAVISISYIVILLHYEIDTSSSRDDDDNDDIDDEVVDGKTTLWQPIKKRPSHLPWPLLLPIADTFLTIIDVFTVIDVIIDVFTVIDMIIDVFAVIDIIIDVFAVFDIIIDVFTVIDIIIDVFTVIDIIINVDIIDFNALSLSSPMSLPTSSSSALYR